VTSFKVVFRGSDGRNLDVYLGLIDRIEKASGGRCTGLSTGVGSDCSFAAGLGTLAVAAVPCMYIRWWRPVLPPTHTPYAPYVRTQPSLTLDVCVCVCGA